MLQLDLHIHSKYSYDCWMRIEKIIAQAKKRGLNGLAITDHQSFQGSQKALQINPAPLGKVLDPAQGCGINQEDDFLIIPGMEISTKHGDVLALFIQREITSRQFSQVLKEIKEQGGLSVLAHPYVKPLPPEKLLLAIDLIEIFNARYKKRANQKALALAKKYQKPVLCNSDAHSYFEIGYGRTLIELQPGQTIKQALLQPKNQCLCQCSPYYLSHGLSLFREKIKKYFFYSGY